MRRDVFESKIGRPPIEMRKSSLIMGTKRKTEGDDRKFRNSPGGSFPKEEASPKDPKVRLEKEGQ